jgi:hypothetical protein
MAGPVEFNFLGLFSLVRIKSKSNSVHHKGKGVLK